MQELVKHIETLEHDQQIVKYKEQLDKAIEYAKKMEIKDVEGKASASNEIGILKKFSKGIDKRRLELLRPYEDAKKRLKGSLDVLCDRAKEAECILAKKLNAFLDAEQIAREKAAKEEQERIRKEMEAKVLELDEQAKESEIDLSDQQAKVVSQAAVKMDIAKKDGTRKVKARGEMFSTTQREVWKAEITDLKTFFLWCAEKPAARMQYWNINQSACNLKAKSIKKEGEANGIRFYSENILVTR